jgi:hypothetical protein
MPRTHRSALRLGAFAGLAVVVLAAAAGAQEPRQRADGAAVAPTAPCPTGTDSVVADAWQAYRRDAIAEAETTFRSALRACPTNSDAATGLGFTRLRSGDVSTADSLFRAATSRDSISTDAWEGRAMTAERMGDAAGAFASWQRAAALSPARADLRSQLERLAGTAPGTAPLERRRAASLDLTLRVKGEGFELRRGATWVPFFMKGVNLGLALPGRFPSEAPTDTALYARWLGQIAAMHANTLRVYTILPPEFYRALRAHNLAHPATPLYLVHGVWTELPPRNDFDDAAFNAAFAEEIRRVVDVLHGAAVLPGSPGHASGRYDADVSPWTIAYILGREWEPYSVIGFNRDPRAARSYAGQHLTLRQGTPTDVWMVRQCDLLLTYEEETYNAQRPIAYTNWPTTDPIAHSTETSYDQQMRFRGLRYDRDPNDPDVHEEEGVTLDPSLVRRTPRNVAGWFASYHVYPYYPDFMLYDPGYSRAASSLGRSNFFGYLQDLRRVHRGIPFVVAEFGVPTSRGNAHLQPQGWHHGGVTEQAAGAANARMATEIREAGGAGAIVFAWMDEWFKRNWFAMGTELPAERGRMWQNMMSSEEHYGLLALRPGAPGRSPEPGGDARTWRALGVYGTGAIVGRDTVTLRVGNDEGFVYVAIESPAWRGRRLPWDSVRFQLAIDTHDPSLGQVVLPTSGIRSSAAFEFLVELNSAADAQLKVTPDYLLYMPHRLVESGAFFGEHFRRPLLSTRRYDAVFDTLYALTNRPRFTAEGRQVRGQGMNVGRLRYARARDNSLADWWYDQTAGIIELRLPWALLNVSDPSSRMLAWESDPEQALGRRADAPPSRLVGRATDGFRFGLVALRPGPDIAGTIPARDAYGNWPLANFTTWAWPTWETPTWHEYLKPSYYALQRLWAAP